MVKYWFKDRRVICELQKDGSYFVVNGSWGFSTDDKPVPVTEEEFNKLEPDFGYW